MQTRFENLSWWTVSLMLTALIWPVTGLACEWRVGWTLYPIYTYPDAEDQVQGADVEILQAVAQRVGCELRFRQLPWKRILLELEKDTLDVTSSASRTVEREAFASFSRDYRQAAMAIYLRAGEQALFPLESLAEIPARQFRLGVVSGYHYGENFQTLMQDPDFRRWVQEAADYQVNITKLLHGRIDGFLVDDAGVLVARAREMGVAGALARHPLALPGESLHFMFSQDNLAAGTLAAVDQAITELDDAGVLDRILGRHLSLDP